MLAAHFFSKRIKTQITLPYQWLNITFNGIRYSSSSTSDSSSSDSDSDSLHGYNNRKKLDIDYLHSAKVTRKRRQIEKQLTKTAQLLSKTLEKDKTKILTELLNTISNIKNENSGPIPKSTKDQNRVRDKDNIEYKKKPVAEGPSIIRMLKNERKMIRNIDEEVRTERETPRELSITRKLKRQRKMWKIINDKGETEQEISPKPSIIRMLKSQRTMLRDINDEVETERETPRKPSITKIPKSRKRMLRLINDEVETEREITQRSSIIGMLKNEQISKMWESRERMAKGIDDEERIAKNINDDVKTKQEIFKKPFTIRTPRRQLKMIENIGDKFEMEQKISEKPLIPKVLRRTKKLMFDDIDGNFETKYETQPLMRKNPSVIMSLKKEQIMHLIDTEYQQIGKPYENIFVNEFLEAPNVPKFKVWDTYEEQELQSLLVRYPKNALEEMIKWTKEGKLWKFPIDNEQGMEKEQSVHFSKHVFLENHLAPWCPSKGPLRHFMELVCVGLSKNPYMTIEEKYDHIVWYKDFFKDKQDLLAKLGLVE